MNNEQFSNKLQTFVAGCQAIIIKHHTDSGFTAFPPATLETSEGQRYVKVIRKDIGGSRSVHLFVDKNNGDVLKAAGWNAPAKGARSNIFNDRNGLDGVTAYGAVYHR